MLRALAVQLLPDLQTLNPVALTIRDKDTVIGYSINRQ